MKYYVVSDIHGFYTEFIDALTEKGFFEDKEPHKLIVCGDLFDRGREAVKLQDFIDDLLKKDEVILIRGNHEDLFEQLLDSADNLLTDSYLGEIFSLNRTLDTLYQLTDSDYNTVLIWTKRIVAKAKNTPYYKWMLSSMKDYYETEKYIFVHGWIPCVQNGDYFKYIENWREQSREVWENARWKNGMRAANKGVIEPNKTIVCGHEPCYKGHIDYEENKGIPVNGPYYLPYYGKGIIAIDAQTYNTHKVNCIVIEDEPLQ